MLSGEVISGIAVPIFEALWKDHEQQLSQSIEKAKIRQYLQDVNPSELTRVYQTLNRLLGRKPTLEELYYEFTSYEENQVSHLERLKAFLSSMWTLRWVAKPVGYILPRNDREEWLGDLEEIHHLMLVEDEYPVWFINLIIAIKALLLIWTAVEVHIVNLFSRNSGA